MPKGVPLAEDHKAKISAALTGIIRHKFTAEHKARLSKSKIGNTNGRGNKGRKHTKEHNAKISASNIGKEIGPETRAKISAANKGKKRSPEFCAAMSVRQKGIKRSPDFCAKVSAGLMGHPTSDETKAKISASLMGKKFSLERRQGLMGRKHTPEHRAKISAGQTGKKRPNICGDKHPRWLGGISRAPYAFSFTPELREQIRTRDDYICQLCGRTQAESSKTLHVHHIDYDKQNSTPLNLITLCVVCNAYANTNRDEWSAIFKQMTLPYSWK